MNHQALFLASSLLLSTKWKTGLQALVLVTQFNDLTSQNELVTCSSPACLLQLLGAEQMKMCSLLQRVLRALLPSLFDGLSISKPLGLHLRESLMLHFDFCSAISDPQIDPQCQVIVSLRREPWLLILAPCCPGCLEINVF